MNEQLHRAAGAAGPVPPNPLPTLQAPPQFPAWLALLLPWLQATVCLSLDQGLESAPAILNASGLEFRLLGAPSLLLGRATRLLPLGTWLFRGSLLPGLALGLMGLLLYRIAWRTLATQPTLANMPSSGRGQGWFSLAASLGVCGSLLAVTQASQLGGASFAVCLALLLEAILEAESRRNRARGSSLLFSGLLLGLLFLESPACFVGLVLWLLPRNRLRPSWAAFALLLLGAGLALVPLLVLSFLRAPRPELLLAEFLPWGPWQVLEQGLRPLQEAGLLFSTGGLCALILAGTSLRVERLGLSLVWIACALWPQAQLYSRAAQAQAGLLLLCLSVLGSLAPAGYLALLNFLRSLELRPHPKLQTLFTAFALAAALAGAEDSRRELERRPTEALRSFTSACLDPLPARSLVLTHSASFTRQLLAAQAQGARPDVLLVPMSKLGDPNWIHRLLQAEPKMKQLLLDLNTSSDPSELGMAELLDTRPLAVELDSSWPERLLKHTSPSPFLATYEKAELSPSERAALWPSQSTQLTKVLQQTRTGLIFDQASWDLVQSSLTELDRSLEKLGEKSLRAELQGYRAEAPSEKLLPPQSSPASNQAPL